MHLLKANSIVRKDEIYRNTYRVYKYATIAIFKYTEGQFNRKRLHYAINYMTQMDVN